MFSLLYSYFLKVRNTYYVNLILLTISFYFIVHSDLDSDLNFNTIIDVILYLLLLYCLRNDKSPLFVIPITLAGVLNRETSIFIPLIFLLWNISFSHSSGNLLVVEKRQNIILLFLISCTAYISVFFTLRLVYGYQVPLIPPGTDLFLNNISFVDSITEINSRNAYYQTFFTGIFIVFFIISGFPKLQKESMTIFIFIVPTWIILHLFLGRLVEARLLLVPIVSICIPFLAEIIAKYNNNLTVSVNSTSV